MAWMMDTYSVQKGYAVPGDRDRQAGLDRRLGLPARGDRRRRRDGDRARLRAARLAASPGCAASSRASATSAASPRPSCTRRARRWSASPTSPAASSPTTGSTSRRCTSTSREHGSLEGFPGARAISNDELLELECDVLVLAAREDQVTARERRRACAAGSSPRARTGRPRSRATRSSPSAASRCCPTCSRTPAASPSRTSSGCRTSAGSSGTATRSAAGSRRSSATRSTACGRCPSSDGLSLRDAALVAGIREVAAALEARGMYP